MLNGLAVLTLLLANAAALLSWRHWENEWTTPLFVVSGWTALFIGGDAAYTLLSGEYGPGEYQRFSVVPGGMVGGVAIWTAALAAFCTGYFAVRGFTVAELSTRSYEGRRREAPVSRWGLRAVLMVGALATIVAAGRLLLQARGSDYSVAQFVVARDLWFSGGGGALLLLLQGLKGGVLIYLAGRAAAGSLRARTVVGLSVLVAIVDLAVGTRSALVFGFILPLLIILNELHRPIRITSLAVGAVVLLLTLGLTYRTFARDIHFRSNAGLTALEVLSLNLRNIPDYFWGGFEASSLDGAIDAAHEAGTPGAWRGETVVNALFAPVPRNLWRQKPIGGGNTYYTRRYYPRFFGGGVTKAEYSISYPGELFFNYGYPGVVLGFLLVGGLLGGVYRLYAIIRARASVRWYWLAAPLYAVVVARTTSLLRGDAFHYMNQLVISVLSALVIAGVYASVATYSADAERAGQ